VLEVGLGTGLNIPFYNRDNVTKLWGLDPSPEMLRLAKPLVSASGIDVELLAAPAEDIPLGDDAVDTIMITYTLCTVSNTARALSSMRRVLKPGGQLIFCEHGLAPDTGVQRWQRIANPAWRLLSGGCCLNRRIPQLIETNGFQIEQLDTMYLPGWRPGSFNYWGWAKIR
jgi:ubiquinone/menaquinone biosynthesis C-methylase UbiE